MAENSQDHARTAGVIGLIAHSLDLLYDMERPARWLVKVVSLPQFEASRPTLVGRAAFIKK